MKKIFISMLIGFIVAYWFAFLGGVIIVLGAFLGIVEVLKIIINPDAVNEDEY